MAETLIERHQDYVINLPTLAGGQFYSGLTFQFDPDAPFELRGLAARQPYDVSGQQNGIQTLAVRYTDSNYDWQQDFVVPLFVEMAYFGQCGFSLPRYPGLRYPASSVVTIELFNFGLNRLTGLQLFFRGVKLFPPGGTLSYTYPAKMLRPPLPFVAALARPANSIANLGIVDARANQVFRVDGDSDFIVRGGLAGLNNPPLAGPYEVFFTLKDETGKPFSNAPVHADVLFGRGVFPPVFTCGPTPLLLSPVGTGASMPGLFYPEIYVPAGHVLLYDVARNDAAHGGMAAVNYPVVLHGMKVWPA